jgi:Bromodomain/TAZ zinc finger
MEISVKMLKKDKSGSPEWLSKLPQMAKQLEVSLYRNARSFDAYMDMTTLKQRLQQIAVQVSQKARSQEQRHDRHRDSQPSTNGMRQDSNSPFMNNTSTTRQDMNNPISSNSNSGGMPGMGSSAGMSSTGGYSRPVGSNGHANSGDQSSGGGLSVSGTASGGRNDPEWKVRIRHKQQRLLLLHHSAKCPHEDGRCPVTPHCADMKRLWRHMEGCKDNQCRVSHCFSSRAILSHYRKCKDAACPACGPVRETVRKSQSGRSTASASGSRQPPGGGMPSASTASQARQMAPNDMGSHSGNSFPSQSVVQSSFSQPQQPQSSMPPPSNPPNVNTSGIQYPTPSVMNSTNSLQGSFDRPGDSSSMRNGASPMGTDFSSPSLSPTGGASQASGGNQSSLPRGRNDSEWQKVRHKQQRLLLLRHASRCQYKGKCPVTPHCASMKKLWEHIAHCKNQQCAVAHCMSSRYVLSHYRRCKDSRCPACQPVRETIRKSHERELQQGNLQVPTSNSNAFDKAPVESVDATESSEPAEFMRPTKRTKIDAAVSDPTISQVPISSNDVQVSKPLVECVVVDSAPLSDSKPLPTETTSAPVALKGSEDHSLLNSFTVEQLTTHLASLNRSAELPPAKLKQKCSEVLKGLQTHQHGWVFNCPVDPVELGLPDYFEIIKKPMDLGTIQRKLESGTYHAIKDFQSDVNLTFDNAMSYNEKGSVVYDMAKELSTKFESDYKKLVQQLDEEDRERRNNERACVLCGCEKRLFEPPVFFCNGMNCASKRIRRNSHFYIGGSNQYFWCNQCFNELDDKTPIELIDLTISKGELKKKKNDEVHEESWVQCDVCERWIHQICGLFNTRQNKEHHSEYCCPLCLLDKLKEDPITPPPKPPGAVDLPRTNLSEFLENHLKMRIDQKRESLAAEKCKTEVCFVMPPM